MAVAEWVNPRQEGKRAVCGKSELSSPLSAPLLSSGGNKSFAAGAVQSSLFPSAGCVLIAGVCQKPAETAGRCAEPWCSPADALITSSPALPEPSTAWVLL